MIRNVKGVLRFEMLEWVIGNANGQNRTQITPVFDRQADLADLRGLIL